jgi:hypothetical protein
MGEKTKRIRDNKKEGTYADTYTQKRASHYWKARFLTIT